MQEYTMSDYLCEELIVEIFTRLPSKSLLRFRSLSKSCFLIAEISALSVHVMEFCVCIIMKKNRITLWNPSIRRELTIPSSSCLNLDEVSRLGTGFGFNPITDDYKIVSIVEVGDDETVETPCVYTLKTGTWCAIASPTPSVRVVLSKACFVNGSLHWAVEDSDAIVDFFYILTFDLSTHVFGCIARNLLDTTGTYNHQSFF
ncbi:hypothetical protein L2E82_50405 [Cichorium intybus]|nr:hypothetical protein L2E82_50405 [Cichorium intybus]